MLSNFIKMRSMLLCFLISFLVFVIIGCSPFQDMLNNTIKNLDFVSVPGGTFTQTNAWNPSESFTHTVSSFYMEKYEVTYQLWNEVYQWAIANGYNFENAGQGSGNRPVTNLNWRDCIVWCNAYSQKTGRTPAYYSDAGFSTAIKDSRNGSYGSSINTTAGSFDNPYVNWSANGYRLPTEGEWQYAASYKDGSSLTPYNYASGATADYSDTTSSGLVGWYADNSGNATHDVGKKNANALGIYDMSGNVWEWCWDWYGSYPGSSTNYKGPNSGSKNSRVGRGGSYDGSANEMQVGFRLLVHPYFATIYLGFRLARSK